MHWTGWIVVVLIILNAGWMTFDGARALVTGDYVTPQEGDHAGQLGPWARLVEAAGIPPRSTLMKVIFVVYGLTAVVMAICFGWQLPWARWGLVLTAVLGLWYLPVGTAVNLIALILLFLPPLAQN